MKKLVSMISILSIIIIMLSGCSNGHEGGVIYDGTPDGLCIEEYILSMLKNDDSPEFVLDGIYYNLDTSNVIEFIDNGWNISIDGYENQAIILGSNERIDIILSKDGHKLSGSIANTSDIPLEISDLSPHTWQSFDPIMVLKIIRISLFVSEKEMEPNYFVTKYGITTATPAKVVKSELKDKEGFKEQSDMYYLISKGDKGDRDILYFSNKNGYTSIKISSCEDWLYSMYKPTEVKEKELADRIATYKANAEANCPNDYSKIVNEIETSKSLHTVPFYSINGNVIYKGTGNYEGMEDNIFYSEDLSLYAVKDSSNQIYIIYEGFVTSDVIKLPELNEGDIISVWGFASKYTTFKDGYKAPTIIANIIEKDGEIIYLSDQIK